MVGLSQIVDAGAAVFAIDRGEKIILWNASCEELLGFPADSVLGKSCWDVLGGRDVHGNRFCYEHCPVVHQLREVPDEPLQGFSMSARTASGEIRTLSVSAFVMDGANPALGVIVHVLKERASAPTSLELKLQRLSRTSSTKPGLLPHQIEDLTPRECEVLRCLAQGLQTDAIAGELGIATVTVRNHVRNILQKLGVHTRFAAVAHAYQAGIA